MPVISVRIPQLGEGLQEALLVEFLKQPGDTVSRDEPIYVMETDKATTDVESPYEGKLIEWTVETGSVLEIGTEIARMEVAEGVKEMPAGHGPADTSTDSSEGAELQASTATATATRPATARAKRSDVSIPPRTKKYLKEKGLLDVVDQIPAIGSKLMPDDVDRFIASGGDSSVAAASTSADFETVSLPQSQIVLNFRLTRGTKVCVPVTVATDIKWAAIEAAREAVRDSGGPTGFAMACWSIVEALEKHDKFRSVLSSDGKQLKVFKNANLGVAVALPGDEMVTAVVANADAMNANEFFEALARQIDIARDGKDQADESTTITVSNIGKAGMRIGIPAIVAPAVATLAIGQTFSHPVPDGDGFKFESQVTATLSFDHRIVNGVGAANFMNDVRQGIENFQLA